MNDGINEGPMAKQERSMMTVLSQFHDRINQMDELVNMSTRLNMRFEEREPEQVRTELQKESAQRSPEDMTLIEAFGMVNSRLENLMCDTAQKLSSTLNKVG